MSWSNVVATGTGKIAFRLVIAGHPIEFVTTPRLEGAGSDGRTRKAGLNVRDIQWGESLDLAQVKLTQQGFTANVVCDYENTISDSFFKYPSRTLTNYIKSTISSTDTVISVLRNSTLAGAYIYVGQECMYVDSVNYATPGAYTVTVTRGVRQTVPMAYYVTDDIMTPEITSARYSVEGITCYLYAYGDTETGNGTLTWTGLVSMQPGLRNLSTIDIPIDGVSKLFDQTLSSDLNKPFSLRGITYEDWNIPVITITRHSTAAYSAAVTTDSIVIGPHTSGLVGFFETQQDWCNALNAAIVLQTAGWGANKLNDHTTGTGPFVAAVVGESDDDSWRLIYKTAAGTAYWHTITVEPAYGFASGAATSIDLCHGSTKWFIDSITNIAKQTLAVSTLYRVTNQNDRPSVYGGLDGGISQWTTSMPSAGSVPRGWIGGPIARGTILANKLYPNITSLLTTVDQVQIDWPDFNGQPANSIPYNIMSSSISPTYNVLEFLSTTGPNLFRKYTSTGLPEITVSRQYASGSNFGVFLDNLISGSAEGANAGRQPMLTTQHIDIVPLMAAISTVAEPFEWLNNRDYYGNSDVSLSKLVVEELKLLGMIPTITAQGKYSLIDLQLPTSTETTSLSIDASSHLSLNSLPGFESNPWGLVNKIEMKTGWNPTTGQHTGDIFKFNDINAILRHAVPSVMKIEPRSSAARGDNSIPIEDVIILGKKWTSVVGNAYSVIAIKTPLTAINTVIGSIVNLSISNIPDQSDGGRGVTNMAGLIIGRTVKPSEACVELKLLISSNKTTGYAPSSDIDTITSAGAGNYNVYLLSPQISGYASITDWVVGDKVRIISWNSDTVYEESATIQSITAGSYLAVVSCGTDLTTLPGLLTMEYDVASLASTSQTDYCYIADQSNLINFTSSEVARKFS